MKFCLQAGESTREKLAIYNQRLSEVIASKVCPIGHIPIGDVPFCEAAIPHRKRMQLDKIIDFYPMFLHRWRHRKIKLIYVDKSTKLTEGFYKRATEWKSDWPSQLVYKGGDIPNNFYYYWSEPVTFTQEWRYYIAEGKVITTGWYSGEDEDEPAPELNIPWHSHYNGAVDFGRLDDGRIALVEAHAPFACGWYGDKHEDYVTWQILAWNGWVSQ